LTSDKCRHQAWPTWQQDLKGQGASSCRFNLRSCTRVSSLFLKSNEACSLLHTWLHQKPTCPSAYFGFISSAIFIASYLIHIHILLFYKRKRKHIYSHTMRYTCMYVCVCTEQLHKL
jgi:hypothetical protein